MLVAAPGVLTDAELGLIRATSQGRMVAIIGADSASLIAASQPTARVCGWWRHGNGNLGELLSDLRRHNREVISHGKPGSFDERRLYQDDWQKTDRSGDRQTRYRGTYTRSTVCIHIWNGGTLGIPERAYDAGIVLTSDAATLRELGQALPLRAPILTTASVQTIRLALPGWLISQKIGSVLCLSL